MYTDVLNMATTNSNNVNEDFVKYRDCICNKKNSFKPLVLNGEGVYCVLTYYKNFASSFISVNENNELIDLIETFKNNDNDNRDFQIKFGSYFDFKDGEIQFNIKRNFKSILEQVGWSQIANEFISFVNRHVDVSQYLLQSNGIHSYIKSKN